MGDEYLRDAKGNVLHVGDILKEDVYTIIGEKIGSVIAVIKKTRKGYVKEIIADNGGVGVISPLIILILSRRFKLHSTSI